MGLPQPLSGPGRFRRCRRGRFGLRPWSFGQPRRSLVRLETPHRVHVLRLNVVRLANPRPIALLRLVRPKAFADFVRNELLVVASDMST